jgi:HlyD family secretion protein
VFAAAFPDTALPGTVESIPLSPRSAVGGSNNALARDYSVKVELDDPQQLALRPGMTCRAEIYPDSAEQALAVPVQAVFSNNLADTEIAPGKAPPAEEHYVFVDAEGRAERRVVQVGLSDDSHQEIRSGLKPGERVVIGPYKVLRHLKDGETLKIVDASEPKAAS